MLKKIFTLLLFAIVIFVAFFAVKAIMNFFPVATKVFLKKNSELKSSNGKTNVLLLGIGGGDHDGPNLTDTIILASVDKANNKAVLISIPRDLWVVSNLNNGEKINEVYADGQLDNQNKGLTFAKDMVSKILGQDVHYGFRIDFNGFVKAVDLINGINVKVVSTLDDYNYPIDGKESDNCEHTDNEIKTFTSTSSAEIQLWDFFSCRYKHLHFDAGLNHMDGITALEFVRSRHGVGEEGSDFARSRRQQLVIEAFREKVLSLNILLNPTKLTGLYTILKDSIDTDISQEDILNFTQLMQNLKTAKITTVVLDYGDQVKNRPGILTQGPVDSNHNYAFYLIPRIGEGNFAEIQSFIKCNLKKGDCVLPKEPQITP